MKHILFITSLLFSASLLAQKGSVSAKVKADGRMPVVVKDPVFRKDTVRITRFGARADGQLLNTKAINEAIAAQSRKGGGVVLVPSGFWLTGPVTLRSNVNLHLAKGALLQFTSDFDQYPLVEGEWEGGPQMRNQSPLSAQNAVNIAITGFGVIDGNGDAWRMVKKDKLTESQWRRLVASGGVLSDDKKTWYPSAKSKAGAALKNPGVIEAGKTPEFYASVKDFLRPNLLVFSRCRNVLLQGVTFQNSPAWGLHPLMCENLVVRSVYVKNPWYAQNGDGIDVESCKNVLIENSTFDVGDDGICIKSGRDAAGRKRGMPTENLLARNNTVYHAHGGFVIGSEMSGGARNIWVDNNTFIGTDIGLRFKSTRGRGGIVENIYVTNTVMKDIVGEAILFDMYYAAQDPVPLAGEERKPPVVEMKPVTEETPQFRNFRINGVVCNGAEKGIFVRGLPEMAIKDVVLENMVLEARKGLDMTEGSGISINNVRFITRELNPVLNIHNSQDISLKGIQYEKAELLLNVSGEKSDRITVSATDKAAATKDLELSYGARPGVVTWN
ncbi:glycoside hydrolase family 28 protein [Flaviaesturariibacter aridisoli]|uniref:Glycoside hydrolase family 28 protein n=1 Tax=Flaviaesturariibacter aridisoli TaxID=2545761 RepID=A0A4R4E6V8_9BACT|nr:glycoside hydrolase family 28 protein [Flaviaesturariibacter aridisoli]TCZ73435.1 glycoside hydrolase family 28 protein [Flaviaesturariibacter aridisoli]